MTSGNCRILDGKALADRVLTAIGADVERFSARAGRAPGLAVILVGDNQASKAYVGNKEKAARRCGFRTFNVHLGADAQFDALRDTIEGFNSNRDVDGILVQLPLPRHLDSEAVIDLIAPEKDADGLHPFNQGLLMRGRGVVRPCTPLGCMLLLDMALLGDEGLARGEKADLAGRTAVVVGRSTLVGKPLALMLLERNATVMMAHSKTAELAAVCRRADVLVAAVGVPALIKKDWIKPGAVVLDVGINRLPSGKLGGDVEFDGAVEVCSAVTPVPGGVGPMTVAMLLRNTFEAFKLHAF